MAYKIYLEQDAQGFLTCDINLSVDDWMDILLNEDITTPNYRNALLCFYKENNHASTCRFIGEKYFDKKTGPQKFNSWMTHFGQKVSKKRDIHIYDETQKERFWPIVMLGRDLDDGLFEWKLRSEIVEAIEALEWD